MAEKSGGPQSVWQCIHCGANAPGMAPGYVMKFCFMCGKKQIMCVNRDCKEPFEEEIEVCSKCDTPQNQSQLPESTTTEVQITCPKCKEPLTGDETGFCSKCNAQQQQQPPTEPQIMCINPNCRELLGRNGADVCTKCNTKQRSSELQILCINPNCKAPLPNDETKVCSECKVSQVQFQCINPDCKAQLSSDKEEMCLKCNSSQQTSIAPTSGAEKRSQGDPVGSQAGIPPPATETLSKATPPTPSAFVESSVDKNPPKALSIQNPPSKGPDPTVPKIDKKQSSAEKKVDSTVENSKKVEAKMAGANAPQTSQTQTQKDGPPPRKSSDSDESCEYQTPPPSRDPLTSTSNTGQRNANAGDLDLTRLNLDSDKCRKHSRDEKDTEDSDEPNATKRRALDGAVSQSSQEAGGASKSSKVKNQGEKGRKADDHKESGQELGRGTNGTRDKGDFDNEVCEFLCQGCYWIVGIC